MKIELCRIQVTTMVRSKPGLWNECRSWSTEHFLNIVGKIVFIYLFIRPCTKSNNYCWLNTTMSVWSERFIKMANNVKIVVTILWHIWRESTIKAREIWTDDAITELSDRRVGRSPSVKLWSLTFYNRSYSKLIKLNWGHKHSHKWLLWCHECAIRLKFHKICRYRENETAQE